MGRILVRTCSTDFFKSSTDFLQSKVKDLEIVAKLSGGEGRGALGIPPLPSRDYLQQSIFLYINQADPGCKAAPAKDCSPKQLWEEGAGRRVYGCQGSVIHYIIKKPGNLGKSLLSR
jgi:hypothetical protein